MEERRGRGAEEYSGMKIIKNEEQTLNYKLQSKADAPPYGLKACAN